MNKVDFERFGDLSMVELFRMEVETQSTILTDGLLALERNAEPTQELDQLMRAAHSLKGAARIVDRKAAVRIAHAMEDCFVAAQKENRPISGKLVDTLLEGVDLLNRIAQVTDENIGSWEAGQQNAINAFFNSLSSQAAVLGQPDQPTVNDLRHLSLQTATEIISPPVEIESTPEEKEQSTTATSPEERNRALRVTTDNLNSLMRLAGEALVASRWLDVFGKDLLRLKRVQHQLGQRLDGLRDFLPAVNVRTAGRLIDLRDRAADCQHSLAERVADLELFDRRFASFTRRLYDEVLDCRMRPFADGVHGFHRMVRDVARSLGKAVRLEITGESTPVDRDIQEQLKAPLDQLLRNAIDHGIETATQRREQGKPEEATLQLQACHSAGMLLVTVQDDGRGIDVETVRNAVVQRKLTTRETTQKMSNMELLEFLFLPGFTLKDSVSEISGRGVGLDVVKTMVKEVGGVVRASTTKGHGTRFQLELPLTLSVVRTLLGEIGGEPYAFPLSRIDRALKLPRERIESLGGRQHFAMGSEQIGLVTARQVLDLEESGLPNGEVSVIVLGDNAARYGLVIDRFLGERELVVRSLDPRLGKVKNISSAALMPDGSPVLIVDTDDMLRSIESLVSGQRLSRVGSEVGVASAKRRKHVLVVDDSLTVRELERKLLGSRGYTVDVAVDGMDGWNAVRTGHYDLVVTDVDMPRLDGIELLKLIRKDNRLKSLPVIIVSYKDREQDRSRGLEAGADHYLTKASFHDQTLVRVVADLIGEAES
jgi:two-component system sensor histidine kinase and response regulator WspE